MNQITKLPLEDLINFIKRLKIMSDLKSLINAQKIAKLVKDNFMLICSEKFKYGMSYDEVILALEELKLIGDESIVSEEVYTIFKDWIETNIFPYNEPLKDGNELINAIENYINKDIFPLNRC